MNKSKMFFKKHSSTILSVTSAVGVITTAVLAVKATPKALKLIEAEKESRKVPTTTTLYADNNPYKVSIKVDGPELTALDIVKVAWKPYIPAALTGISTIACIFGMSYLNTKVQTSLLSAYAVLEKSYREYREKNIEMNSVDTDIDIRRKIANSNYYKNIEVDDNKELFFDYTSMQYFESTLDEVKEAVDTINQVLDESGFVYLNDFYDILGIPRVDYGYNLGWFSDKDNLQLDYEKVEIDGGLECWIITMSRQPLLHL